MPICWHEISARGSSCFECLLDIDIDYCCVHECMQSIFSHSTLQSRWEWGVVMYCKSNVEIECFLWLLIASQYLRWSRQIPFTITWISSYPDHEPLYSHSSCLLLLAAVLRYINSSTEIFVVCEVWFKDNTHLPVLTVKTAALIGTTRYTHILLQCC